MTACREATDERGETEKINAGGGKKKTAIQNKKLGADKSMLQYNVKAHLFYPRVDERCRLSTSHNEGAASSTTPITVDTAAPQWIVCGRQFAAQVMNHDSICSMTAMYSLSYSTRLTKRYGVSKVEAHNSGKAKLLHVTSGKYTSCVPLAQ